MNRDIEHLKLLSVFHYVFAGVTALFGLLPLIYVFLGLVILLAPNQFAKPGQDAPPEAVGRILICLGLVLLAFFWFVAGLIFVAGRFLARQKHHTFCVIIASLECIFVPLGTVLGVFTLVILMRETVKPLFETTNAEFRK
ncbi:MAG TPA: hypothetical protein VMB22_02125 [Verrucomicrobiae bacterium]|nr:hypothetical protein [Verrucomicrobiae bacterium]